MKLSISNLEHLSGVPIHTIRVWERRYNALEPLRSAGNTRFYNDGHLKRLLNIVSLNQSGLKISQACAMSEAQIDQYLEKEINSITSHHANFEYYVSQLLKYGIAYNEARFTTLLDACIAEYGVLQSYQEVIYPLLQRLGLMWRREHICPAQEHFLSGIIRQKLMVAINSVPVVSQNKATWLLFLPEDEGHDIPLLLVSYLLRNQGFKVIYLGANVPFESLKDVYSKNEITNMLFFMIRQRPIKEANAYFTALAEEFSGVPIYLAGNSSLIKDIDLTKNMVWFSSIAEFQEQVSLGIHD